MSPEFAIIEKYFKRPAKRATLGIGDDCALIRVSPACELAISTDTLVAGIHFFANADPEKLGHKALAVNLSDLAAMGATPRYATLALTIPNIDEPWLAAFSRGFFSRAEASDVELIGGDTTRGPLSITLTLMGEVGLGQALRRDGAMEGDDIWVSGSLGAAAMALKHLNGATDLTPEQFDKAAERLHTPSPRIVLGRALLGLATSAIDVSDGLVADLGHICECSGLSAQVLWEAVPKFEPLLATAMAEQIACVLTGGDDYELCFTAPESMRQAVLRVSVDLRLPLSRIGSMLAGAATVIVHNDAGEALNLVASGFDHFRSAT